MPMITAAPSRPLKELEPVSLLFDEPVDSYNAHYHYSNDESAEYFKLLADRHTSEDYKNVTNRTALLVGESALAAALPYIPEETVLVVDFNPAMFRYMCAYVATLRNSKNLGEWHQTMADKLGYIHPNKDFADARDYSAAHRTRQIKQWHAAGLEHALADEAAFRVSSDLAKKKAIVPWCANLKSDEDMDYLGQELKRLDANITFLNLTNIVEFTNPGASEDTDRGPALEYLPITDRAPIMCTSSRAVTSMPKNRRNFLLGATGPFYGPQSFLQNCGNLSRSDLIKSRGLPITQKNSA